MRCAGDALTVPEPPVVLDTNGPADDPGVDVRVFDRSV
jgi:hypothetical protein